MKPENSHMPAIIVCIVLAGFFSAQFFIMWKLFSTDHLQNVEAKEALTMLGMLVVATINLTTGAVGYWLGTTHNSANKDIMLHNSTPSPAPTEQTVRSVTTSTSTPAPEEKP